MKISIYRNELKAALLLISKDPSRCVLNGVKFEARKKINPRLVSTDGRRLSVIQTTCNQWEDRSVEDFILSWQYAEMLINLSATIGKRDELITFTKSQTNHLDVLISGMAILIPRGAIILGNFPKWSSVLPNKSEVRFAVNQITINSEYLAEATIAAKLLGSKDKSFSMLVSQGQDCSPIIVRVGQIPNWYLMIMPIRNTDDVEMLPGFVLEGNE